MRVEYDTEVGAFYVHVSDAEIARAADVADLINVDVAADGTVVGLELLCSPSAVTTEERARLAEQFPAAAAALAEIEALTRRSR
jgi:uncharacterized protein YuzE